MSQTKTIPLTRGAVAIVDADEYEKLVSMGSWYLSDTGYAILSNKKVRMHREVNKTPKSLLTDHLNNNRLDNRKANLRSVNASENAKNKARVKGYCWDKYHQYWVIRVRGVSYGTCRTEAEAKEIVKRAKSGMKPISKQHPRRKYLPRGVYYMQPNAQKGKPPYYIKPQIKGKQIFQGYFSSVQAAEEAYTNLLAQGGLTS